MGSETILTVLRIFLIVLGGFTVIWGVYDMFGDGQQNSMGIKKIIGGVAFAAISGFLLTWAISEVGKAEAEAGIKTARVFLQNWNWMLRM